MKKAHTFKQDEVRAIKDLLKESTEQLVMLQILQDELEKIILSDKTPYKANQLARKQLKANVKLQNKVTESIRQCYMVIQVAKNEAVSKFLNS